MHVPTHQIEVCRGLSQTGCPHALYGETGLTVELEKVVADSGWPCFLDDTFGGRHHRHHAFSVAVSACANGCARPHIADFGLVRACEPGVAPELCTGCGECAEACPDRAIELADGLPVVDPGACVRCGICVRRCGFGAMACASEGWRVLVGGRLGRHPKLARELDGLRTTGEALDLLARALRLYMDNYGACVRFGVLLDRLGPEALEGTG